MVCTHARTHAYCGNTVCAHLLTSIRLVCGTALQELRRLSHNQALRDLDIRLNPVTTHDPEYRLFLVHLLPNLRRPVNHK